MVSLEAGEMNVWVGEMRPREQEIEREQEEGKETTYSGSPSYQSTPFIAHQILLQFFPLKLQSKHTADMISFSQITGPSELMTFLPPSGETISFCLM